MKPNGIAFDKASARTFDADGRMHVAKTNISKANVCPYLGKEIPGYEELGLEPNKIYKLYRDPKELEKSASTFNNIQLLHRHIQVSADEPQKDSVCGCLSNVYYEHPYLKADMCVWTSEAIALIEAEKLDELSPAYRYKVEMNPGTSMEGEPFDGSMSAILGNHLCLVETGRTGSDVMVADSAISILQANEDLLRSGIGSGKKEGVIADSNPFKKEVPAMKKTALGNALLVALQAASPKLAQDSALPKLVGGAVKRNFDKKAVAAQICAMDEDFAPEKVDEIVDAVLGVEQNPEPLEPKKLGEDENDGGAPSKHAEIIDFLKSKGMDASDLEAVGNMLTRMGRPYKAEDENLMKPEAVQEKVDTAMDAMRKEFRALESAKSAVRQVVGDVIGMDSAEQVYRFALDQMKIDHKETPAAGLGNLFAVASAHKAAPNKPVFANDSASIAKIPGLDRFRVI